MSNNLNNNRLVMVMLAVCVSSRQTERNRNNNSVKSHGKGKKDIPFIVIAVFQGRREKERYSERPLDTSFLIPILILLPSLPLIVRHINSQEEEESQHNKRQE